MKSKERRRYEMFIRARQFGVENAADFPAGSLGAGQFAVIAEAIEDIESASAEQMAGYGEAAQQFEVKDLARENLRDEMSAIARTARSMEYSFTGITDKFYFQRNLSGPVMLAAARAFAADALDYQADFIAYGLPAAFISELTTAADAFEAAFSATASARAEHVTATAENAGHVRRGMIAKRVLDGIVKNKYAGNIGKLAAWLSASHVEREPKRKKPPTAHLPVALLPERNAEAI